PGVRRGGLARPFALGGGKHVGEGILASILFGRAKLREDAEVFEGRRVSLGLSACGNVLQEPPHDLPASRLRQRVGEAYGIGPRELSDLLVDVRGQRLFQLLARWLPRLDGDEDDERLPL